MKSLRTFLTVYLLLVIPAFSGNVIAQDEHPLAGIKLRSLGPALTSGRISDFAFHPEHHEIYYVATASGGVWKTDNDGISWQSVFDHEGSFSTGVVALDPNNPHSVWVGSGENNSQRSVGFGDGIYRSLDGGKSWENMGLKDSGHISMIAFHPEQPATVYVAAQGPLWNSGGDRGLYRSSDYGKTWQAILQVDADTGVNEFHLRDGHPDTILASTYQRRRHVWTLINGGPGGGVHKSTDGGKNWRKITQGLPGGDLGRIGLAVAPSQPDMVYAIVEAAEDDRGVYRSTDFGESWEKRSSHTTTSPQYYNELVVDPGNPDRVYSLDTFTNVSEDGGKTWTRLSFENRHVDDHALWIDPDRTEHLYIGGDGGIYESWDRGQSWRHVRNLPVTQFYRVTPDNDAPFYNVCGGTQDNHTLCGPVRTRFTDGVTNADWWISQFGDGFKTQFDPDNPAIVYSQYQYGGLNRYDRVTGEGMAITPQPPEGQNDYKWNWNSPLIVSPHNPARLYYASERVLRSDDRGDSWREISPDLSRGLDRNQLKVMGRVWSVDSISKNASTSMYGSIIALAESPLREGLIYVGTDDGLFRVTSDGGENWSRVSSVPGVPDQSLIEDIAASSHDASVAYAVVDNHKRGDHKPYVLKSMNSGKSWTMISNNLPERGTAHTIVEDPVNAQLLFVGTEFGVFFSNNGGGRWHELNQLPTVAVRDLEIQPRENDLVIGTFGRGIWVLDDLTPLRSGLDELDEPILFPVRDDWLFIPDVRRGWGGLGDYGSGRYSADNPAHGANFRYFLKDGFQSAREARRESEKDRQDKGEDNPYPDWETLRAEELEEAPTVILTVSDLEGRVLRRLKGPAGKGLHQLAWDMRLEAPDPVNLQPSTSSAPWLIPPRGPLVTPGRYRVALAARIKGELKELGEPREFQLTALSDEGLVAENPEEVLEFQRETAEVYRRILAGDRAMAELSNRLDHVLVALDQTPASTPGQAGAARNLVTRLELLQRQMDGDRTIASRAEPVPLSITGRIANIVYGHWDSRARVPLMYRESLQIAEKQFNTVSEGLHAVAEDLKALETELETLGAPFTPGRLPGLN